MQAAMVPCCASTTEDVTAIVRKDTATIVVRRKVVRAVMLKFLWARIAPLLIANSGGGFDLYQTPTNRLVDVRFGSKADMCSALSHVCFTPKSDIEFDHFGKPQKFCEGGTHTYTCLYERIGESANKSLAGSHKTRHSSVI